MRTFFEDDFQARLYVCFIHACKQDILKLFTDLSTVFVDNYFLGLFGKYKISRKRARKRSAHTPVGFMRV